MGRKRRNESSPENRQHRYREGQVPDPPGVITWHGGSGGEGRTKCTAYFSKDSEMAWHNILIAKLMRYILGKWSVK